MATRSVACDRPWPFGHASPDARRWLCRGGSAEARPGEHRRRPRDGEAQGGSCALVELLGLAQGGPRLSGPACDRPRQRLHGGGGGSRWHDHHASSH
jgi:hypothetical protein